MHDWEKRAVVTQSAPSCRLWEEDDSFNVPRQNGPSAQRALVQRGEEMGGWTKQETTSEACGFWGEILLTPPQIQPREHSREESQDAFFSVNRGEGA